MELFVGPRRGAQPGAPSPPAPTPTVDNVTLRAAGAEAVAALVITGNVTPETAAFARARLVGAWPLLAPFCMCRDATFPVAHTPFCFRCTRLPAAALAADGLALAPSEADGGFRLSQFGPLYTLKPRRNELLLRVQLG
jgi:hypothetical protein